MATTTTKGVPTQHINGGATVTEVIETKSKAVEEAATKAGSKVTEVIEAKSKAVEEAATKAGDTLAVWLRKLPLASLGFVAVIGDEAKDFVGKLFMNKLVERGEVAQKDAEQWMKDMQARFR